MNRESSHKKQFPIADYRWKYIVYTMVCSTLVVAGLLTFHAKERSWQFWIAETVMSVFALGLLYMLFSPKYVFIGRKGAKYEEWMENEFQEMLRDEGYFSYSEEGFEFRTEDSQTKVNWNDILKITAHLEDNLGNDQDLCLHIDYGEKHFLEIDEEVPGWILFAATVRQKFNLSPTWQQDTINAAKKEAILYQKN